MRIKKGLNPRLAEIGKIKIGGKGKEVESKKGKKFRIPVKFDCFVVTTTERDSDGNFMPDPDVMGTEGVGDEPKELSIRLPFDDISMNFHTSYQLYEGAKLKCKGDGETATRRKEDGSEEPVACNLDTCKHMEQGKCKVSGILSCYLVASPSYGGVYRFRTHSWNSVSNILAALDDFSLNTGGILQGLPLKLKMLKKSTEEHGNVNTVTLVLDGIEIAKMRDLAYQEKRNRANLKVDIKAIEQEAVEAGFKEDHDNPEDIEAEFYSEPEVKAESKEAGASAEDIKEKMESEPKPSESAGSGEEEEDLF
jgi:hypothetical protein